MGRMVVFASPLTTLYQRALPQYVNYGWDSYSDPNVIRFAQNSLLYHAWIEFNSVCTLEQWSVDECPFIQPESFPELLGLLDSLLCEIALLLQKPELRDLGVEDFDLLPGGVMRIALAEARQNPTRRRTHGPGYQRRPAYRQPR